MVPGSVVDASTLLTVEFAVARRMRVMTFWAFIIASDWMIDESFERAVSSRSPRLKSLTNVVAVTRRPSVGSGICIAIGTFDIPCTLNDAGTFVAMAIESNTTSAIMRRG